MSTTGQHVTDGDGTPDPVVADVVCGKLLIRPKLTDVTNGYLVYDPDTTRQPFNLAEGEDYTFEAGGRMYQAGETVGYTKSVNTGPFTFNKKHLSR
jgi:hypothetical protein